MLAAHLLLTAISNSAAISACEKARILLPALGLLATMLTARLLLNVVTFPIAISACGKAQQWHQALDLLLLPP